MRRRWCGKLAWRIAVAATVVCLAGVACEDAPPGPAPEPGDVAVTLVSPNGAEGAAVLTTSEAGIIGVTAEAPVQVFHWREAGVDRIVALRDEAGVIRFGMSVADVNRPPRLFVIEVADAANRLRATLSGYGIEVEPLSGAGP